jgi:hypothetical protein
MPEQFHDELLRHFRLTAKHVRLTTIPQSDTANPTVDIREKAAQRAAFLCADSWITDGAIAPAAGHRDGLRPTLR